MFELQKLNFEVSAFEPYIDAQTMTIHHDKHHAGYVDNLNKALAENTELQQKELWNLLSDLDTLPEEIRTKVRNNGGGHANHTFFWKLLSPASESGMPTTTLQAILEKNFGSMDEFKTKFKEVSLACFGSGWAWVVLTGIDTLEIVSTGRQDTPWNDKKDAILGLDVWEHAYYLKYQNKRADYIDAFWNIVNWKQVDENLQKALSYLKA